MIPNQHAEPHFVQEPFLFSILTPSQAYLTRNLTKSVDSVLGAQIALNIFYCPLHMYIYWKLMKIVFPHSFLWGGRAATKNYSRVPSATTTATTAAIAGLDAGCHRCHCSYLVLQSAALSSKREHIVVPMAQPDPLHLAPHGWQVLQAHKIICTKWHFQGFLVCPKKWDTILYTLSMIFFCGFKMPYVTGMGFYSKSSVEFNWPVHINTHQSLQIKSLGAALALDPWSRCWSHGLPASYSSPEWGLPLGLMFFLLPRRCFSSSFLWCAASGHSAWLNEGWVPRHWHPLPRP